MSKEQAIKKLNAMRELLVLARAKLKDPTKPWGQGDAKMVEGTHCCTMSALAEANVETCDDWKLQVHLEHKLKARANCKWLPTWNDKAGRTVEEVEALYDAEIASIDKQLKELL